MIKAPEKALQLEDYAYDSGAESDGKAHTLAVTGKISLFTVSMSVVEVSVIDTTLASEGVTGSEQTRDNSYSLLC